MQKDKIEKKRINFSDLGPDLAILIITIVINCLVTGFFDIELFGLFFAPFFGGVVRGLFMRTKTSLIMAPIMCVLDIILFVPMMFPITGYDTFSYGYALSWIVGLEMLATSFIAIGIRVLVLRSIRKKNKEWNKNFTEFINFK